MKFSEHIRGAALAAGLALSGASSEGGHKESKMTYSEQDLRRKNGADYRGIQEVDSDGNYLYFRVSLLNYVAVPKNYKDYIDQLQSHFLRDLENAKSEQEKKKIRERFEEFFGEKLSSMGVLVE